MQRIKSQLISRLREVPYPYGVNDGSLFEDQVLSLRQIIDSAPALIHTARPDGFLDFFNQTWLDFFGQPLKNLLGWEWTSYIHPEDVEAFVQKWREAIAAGERFEGTARMRRADGVYRWMLHHELALRDGDGRIIKWNGSMIDIEDRKRAEEHLRDTHVKLARASRIATVAELSASIAHELNQPLMSIFANAQAAKRWLAATSPNMAEVNTSIERILRDARAADETMQRIRALFKQEPFEKKDVNVPDMLSEAVGFVYEDPKKRRFRIDWSLDDHLPTVSVDLTQIQQVFINLISNAIETLEGSPIVPRIVVRASVIDQSQMLFQVADNGPGVADEERIFDAFFTTKKNGMGIGLAVSRSIVEAHGGRLWAHNNPQGGTTFNVVLPLSPCRSNPSSTVTG